MIILGLASTRSGDAAAALFVDQTLVATADEAALARSSVTSARLPWAAARCCLQQAGLTSHAIDAIAMAGAPRSWLDSTLWYSLAHTLQRSMTGGVMAALNHYQRRQRYQQDMRVLLQQLGCTGKSPAIATVSGTLAHASAGYYLFGGMQDALYISHNDGIDGHSTLLGFANNGQVKPLKYQTFSDSLSQVVLVMGAYLGFSPLDTVEGIALLARHGDPLRYDLGKLFSTKNGTVRVNAEWINPNARNAWRHNGMHYPFTQRLVDWLGPPAIDAPAIDPHAHYAAALCRLLENTLRDQVKTLQSLAQSTTGATPGKRVLLCGDIADGRWLSHLSLQGPTLQVTPGNATTAALGAAAWLAALHGIKVDPLTHSFWGPGYLSEECIAACKRHSAQPVIVTIKDSAKKAARLLAEGHGVCWFQGRLETTSWPLGARAILYSPTSPKRPLNCARTGNTWSNTTLATISVNSAHIKRYTDSTEAATFASGYIALNDEARAWLPADLQINGTAPLHSVQKATSSRLHVLLDELEKLTGHGAVVQLPLQTLEKTAACSPTDALDAWWNSSAEHLIMEDIWVKRTH